MTKSDLIKGVKLFGKVSRTTASLIVSNVKSTVSNDAVENMRRAFDREQSGMNLARELKYTTKEAKGVACACGAIVGALIGTAIAS